MRIEDAITGIIEREGSQYTDHAADRGGPTKYGITQATLSAWRGRQATPGEVMQLTENDARAIYRKRYVVDPGFDKVALRRETIAFELVDTGVNMGTAVAGRFLQQALNVLNREQRAYRDIPEDGEVGPGTLAALDAYLAARGSEGEVVLMRALNCLQGTRYIEIARARPSQEAFVYGWLAHRVGL